jgi:uncharacterized membrane protein
MAVQRGIDRAVGARSGAGADPLELLYFGLVTAPLLLDRDHDAVTAALIAALTVIGFASLMIGMIAVFPWLGHASWHAYRELVE